jgi:hypothetical protein
MITMQTTQWIFLLSGVLFAACATNAVQHDGDGFATMTVEPASVAPGGAITVTLTNNSDQQLGYNLCPVALERMVGDEWEQRPERPAEVCTMELRVLDPGSSASYEHTIPPGVPPGSYRFTLRVEWPLGADQVGVVSEPFEVRT